MMIKIPLSEVHLSLEVAQRWVTEVQHASEMMRAAGIECEGRDESLYDLGDGRLRLICEAAPGFSIILDAQPGEWMRVTDN